MGLFESRKAFVDLVFEQGVPLQTDNDWSAVENHARNWFADMKAEESREKFHDAFTESRMTVRAILEERHTGHYTPEKVALKGGDNWANTEGKIKTMQGIKGMKERMNPENFFGAGARERQKYKKGLFDVSAVLLDGGRSLEIGSNPNQMYRTSGNTTWIFMPVPRQLDMMLFFMLNDLAKEPETKSAAFKTFVAHVKSRLTRIKFAFEGDAGAIFVLSTAPDGDIQPKIKYGFGNLMPRSTSAENIRKRRIAALTYKTILKGTNRNEIIVAYRQHGLLSQPTSFPVYAKAVYVKTNNATKPLHKGFVEIDENMKLTGNIIDVSGNMRPGTEADFGIGASILNHSPPKYSVSPDANVVV